MSLDAERAAQRRVNEATRKALMAARAAVSARGGALALKALAEALAEEEAARGELRVAEVTP